MKKILSSVAASLPLILLTACGSDRGTSEVPTPTQLPSTTSETASGSPTTSTAGDTSLVEVDASKFLASEGDGYLITFADGTTCRAWNSGTAPMIDCPFSFPASVLVDAEIPSMATHPGNQTVANVIRFDVSTGFVPKALFSEGQLPTGTRLNPGEKVALAGFTFEQPDPSTFTGTHGEYAFKVSGGTFSTNHAPGPQTSSPNPASTQRLASEFAAPGSHQGVCCTIR